MKRKEILAILVFFIAFTCGFFCTPNRCLAETPQEVRIGVTAPLTGPAAEAGVALKEGAIMAAEEWNADGGIFIEEAGKKLPIKILVEDCQSKPEVGVSVGEKLITRDKVNMLIGDMLHSSVTMAVMELAPKYGIPVLSAEPVSTEIAKKVKANPKRYWSYWKGNWNSDALGGAVFDTYKYLIEKGLFKPKSKKIAFIVEDTDWGRSNAQKASEFFKGAGWETLTTETVPLGHTDFYPQLTKIKSMSPDILVTSFTPLSSGVACTKQFHELGLKCGHMGIYYPSRPEYLSQVGKMGNYLLWTTSFIDPVNIPRHKEFARKVQKRWGVTPNMDHASGYDVVYNALDSIKRAESLDPKTIVESLSKLDRPGVLGRYVFNQEDHAILAGEDYIPVPGIQIQNGKDVVIYPSSLAVGFYQKPPWMNN